MSVFFKAAGGKRQLLTELHKHVPDTFNRYFEPFVGAGALHFHLRETGFPGEAILNDGNVYIAMTYITVKNDLGRLVKLLKEFAGLYEREGEEFYYGVRTGMLAFNSVVHESAMRARAAAQFLFTNRTGFNGLWRVNASGKFNVPHGRYANPTICNEGVLSAARKALVHSRVYGLDFEEMLCIERPMRGDFVYFDPPYWPLGGYADFVNYTKEGFGQVDQERLRDVAIALKARGVKVLLSNADVPPVRALYAKRFEMRRVEARRSINSKTSRRKEKVGELLIW